jgi:dienelactone hydrolase
MKRLPLFALWALAACVVEATPQVLNIEWRDAARERVIPLKVRVPDGDEKLPVVIFSHGLGGSREGGRAWGEHWAAHGYLVIHVQHPGSDESLWKGATAGVPEQPVKQRLARGATPEQLLGRVDDIRFVLDNLTRLQSLGDAPSWARRADPGRVAMTGHSFGALTTQALAGQRYPGPIKSLADPRLRAFIAFSPSTQGLKRTWPDRYGEMSRPFLSVTGSFDGDVMATGSNAGNRAALFDAQPPGDKFRVVFERGDHAVFGGGDERDSAWMQHVTGERRHVTDAATARLIRLQTQRVTLRFLDAYLKNDAAARAWLASDAAKALAGSGEWSVK